MKRTAFWKYDLFPYMLHGEYNTSDSLTKGRNDGRVYIPSYQGHVHPAFTLPLKEGKQLAAALDNMRAEKRTIQHGLDQAFDALLFDLLQHYGVKRP